jgi:Tol biopolymer transport system component
VRIRTQRTAAVGVAIAAFALGGCDEKITGNVDDVAPEMEIASPVADGTVSGVGFFVSVTATDDVGVDRVEVSVDGAAPDLVTQAPYRAHVVTLGRTPGSSLSIQAEAFDAAGNSTRRTVRVNVAPAVLMNITAGDPQEDSNPSWSPDGTRIAFQSNRNSGELNLWTIDPDGTNAVQLTTNVNEDRHPAWSPDGAWIAFDSDRAGTFDIWLLPVAGDEADAQNLTFGNDDDVEPAWSPGGATIYFASSRGDETDFDIWRQDVGTGAATQITSFAEDDRAPAISADGTRLAFASSLNFSTDHIYTTVLGETGVAPLTGDVGVTEADPAWGPTGTTVVFTHHTGAGADLYSKPLDPDVAAVQGTFSSGALGDGGAAWSPDGTRIAFHSDRDGNLDIWVVQ